jgi:uncharacterized membrane protein HdeD (DUF308 family)
VLWMFWAGADRSDGKGNNMSTNQFTYNPFVAGINEIRSSWGWFLTAGIGLLVLGAICIIGSVAATFATILVVGWLLLFGGVVALVHAFRMRTWSGFFLYFVTALLRGFTGYLLIRYPLAGALTFTLVLALFFVVGGLLRTIGAAMMKFPNWGWIVFSGVVSVGLGIMLLVQMPVSSLWFLGFAVGVEMLVDGGSLVGFATAIHSLPKATSFKPKAA